MGTLGTKTSMTSESDDPRGQSYILSSGGGGEGEMGNKHLLSSTMSQELCSGLKGISLT